MYMKLIFQVLLGIQQHTWECSPYSHFSCWLRTVKIGKCMGVCAKQPKSISIDVIASKVRKGIFATLGLKGSPSPLVILVQW